MLIRLNNLLLLVLLLLLLLLLLPLAPAGASSCDASPTDSSPRGVHLAYTGGDASTEIGVSFFTCAGGGGSEGSKAVPTVKVFGGDMRKPKAFRGVSSSYYSRPSLRA